MSQEEEKNLSIRAVLDHSGPHVQLKIDKEILREDGDFYILSMYPGECQIVSGLLAENSQRAKGLIDELEDEIIKKAEGNQEILEAWEELKERTNKNANL